jgi:nucleotide-binding universal stress UspA family protein
MVRHGYPRLVVVTEAADLKADLVILGAPRQHKKGIHLPVGSVTRTVLRSAHCSVDIARPRTSKPHEGNRVLVATDGSEDSQAAIRFIAGRPWTKDTVFEVLSVAESMKPVAGFYPGFLDEKEMDYLTTAGEDNAKRAITEAEAVLRAARLQVVAGPSIPSGTTNEEILREAERFAADLIVVGSHGARGFRQFLIGSVSESVAMHAPCSVEVHRTA